MDEIVYEMLQQTQDWSVNDEDPGIVHNDNPYLCTLVENSSLKLLQESKIKKAFKDQGSMGLFRLFITNSFMNAIRNWTNYNLKNKGLKEVNEKKFRAYVGLEMAMSIVQFNDISYYWKTEMFTGHEDFKRTMSRDDFMNIRANIELRDPESYNHDEASADPLWHSRKLLEHFQKNISQLAVPTGTSALDEASVRTKCRSRARSYMPNKPDKYAVRFYVLVGTKNAYISSIVDNRSGNHCRENGPESFCRVFREMRTPYNNFLRLSNMVDEGSPSALWILQMAQQTKIVRDPSGKRVFFCDNFYTRHTLASELKRITDGEARLCGTVKFTNVDSTNRPNLAQGISMLKDAPRGSWKLIRAYDKIPTLDVLRRKHLAEQRKKPPSERSAFVVPTELVAEKAGYIVWKDTKVVVFYTNDLCDTPTRAILDMDDDEAKHCVHGLAPIERWTGNESLHRSIFMVPAIIVAYNMFMNSVDRMDQRRATNPTRRKEQRLHMSMFTFILDLAALQAFALHQVLDDGSNVLDFISFKRSICESLVKPHRSQRKIRRASEIDNSNLMENVIGTVGDSDGHLLIENINKTGIHCHFCLLRGVKKKTIYGCTKCGRGFHVNCYTAFHFQGALKSDTGAFAETILNTERPLPRGMNKKSKYVGDISTLTLT